MYVCGRKLRGHLPTLTAAARERERERERDNVERDPTYTHADCHCAAEIEPCSRGTGTHAETSRGECIKTRAEEKEEGESERRMANRRGE